MDANGFGALIDPSTPPVVDLWAKRNTYTRSPIFRDATGIQGSSHHLTHRKVLVAPRLPIARTE